MKKICIMTDSHSGIRPQEAEQLGIKVLPMPFYIEGKCYYENTTLTRQEFFEKLRAGANITTSQPSPESVMRLWDETLAEYDEIMYIPISSGLSGSCETAMAFAQNKTYRGRVFVVDNGRVSVPLRRSVTDALEMVSEGCSAEQIKVSLENSRENMMIYIGVENLDCLKRGGRVSAATAAGWESDVRAGLPAELAHRPAGSRPCGPFAEFHENDSAKFHEFLGVG